MRKLLYAGLLACAASAAIAAPARHFTVEDSIAFSTFANPGILYDQATPRVLRSPDGTHYAVVTVAGDLASGKRVATLWTFDTADIERALSSRKAATPRKAASWATASNVDPVQQWRWRSDSHALLFLAADDEGARTLMAAPLTGGAPIAISAAGQSVSEYDEAAGTIVYLARPAIPESQLYQAGGADLPDIVEASGLNIFPLLFPHAMATTQPGNGDADTLWRAGGNRSVAVLDPATGKPVTLRNTPLALSPDGTRVLARGFVADVPEAWERYTPPGGDAALRFVADKPGRPKTESIYRPQSFITIDLATGARRTVLDAPIEIGVQFQDVSAAWSPRGDRIAVRGLYPSLAADDRDVSPCAVGIVEVTNGALECLQATAPRAPKRPIFRDRPQVVGLYWDADDQGLTIVSATPNAPALRDAVRYRRAGAAWTQQPPLDRDAGLSVDVREALDEPPTLIARRGTGKAAVIFDPNPQLAQIAHSPVIPYSWKDPDGDVWSGALVLPPDYQRGRRYPLLLQTHGLDRSRYLVDGPSPTGFAARALAARGMIVLQVAETGKKSGTPEESKTGSIAYRAAIRALDAEGMIDPRRVGAIAWSHYGPWVMQGLVDHPDDYAAVSFAETAFNGYDEYLQNIDYLGAAREKLFRNQVGPKPFGAGLETWFARSAGFQTDRVCTPIFWQINDPLALPYSWGSYAALRAENKPVDLLYMRGGSHVLMKPRERLIEQGMNVDWFDFWLNGREDPDPAKAAQYARWRVLKDMPRCGDEGATPPPER